MATRTFPENAPMAAINVTPLVDVMLVLLIIFMITAPMVSHRLLLQLPVGESPSTKPPEAEALVLQILVDGRLVLAGKPIGANVFAAEMAHIGALQKPPAIEISVADATEYRHVVDALAVIKGEGIRRIGFVDALP